MEAIMAGFFEDEMQWMELKLNPCDPTISKKKRSLQAKVHRARWRVDIQQKELDEEERWAEKMREDIEEVRFRMGRKLYERSMQDSMEQDLQAESHNIHADLN